MTPPQLVLCLLLWWMTSTLGLQGFGLAMRRLLVTRRHLSASDGPSAAVAEAARDAHFMRLALRHAQFAFREKEVPIGAVVVDEGGRVIAAGRNSVETLRDASAHAELSVLKKASAVLGNWRLQGCTLYTTLEPCAMCMGAAQGFRVRRLVYGAADHRLGACGSWINLADKAHPFCAVAITGGVLATESSILLRRFFQLRRREAAGAVVGGLSLSPPSLDEFSAAYELNGGEREGGGGEEREME